MSERESWMPDEEWLCMTFDLCDQAREEVAAGERPAGTWLDPLRTLIRAAVEKALAEQREEWIAALKAASGEYKCHSEADPTYWAELLSSSRDAYHKQDARHAREVERARLEGKIETMTQVGGYADRITELRAAIAALEVDK